MSRCFPFPPPEYEKNNRGSRSGGTRLIFSIKVKKGQESAEEEKKRKEKKIEKKKGKKSISIKTGIVEEREHVSHKRHKGVKSRVGQKVERIEQSEHLEKSGLTEEHGEAVRGDFFCNSPDSIDDGSKRKRQKVEHDANHGFGTRLRIRLPLLNSKEQRGPNKQEACSSGSRMVFQQERIETRATITATTTTTSFPKIRSESSESLGRTLETEIALYRDLTENWVPSIQREYTEEIDDHEWLFKPQQQQQQHKQEEKRWKGQEENSNGVSGWRFCSASYLPEAGIYALPFTVPY